MIMKILASVLLASLAVSALAPATVSANHKSTGNIVEVTSKINARTGMFDTLLAAATCTDGIAEALATADPITVFAPTDRAFRKAGFSANPDRANYICNDDVIDEATRATVLKYHVFAGAPGVDGKVTYREARTLATRSGTEIPMLGGGNTELIKRGWWNVKIDGKNSKPSRIVLPNVFASNGVIHVIDRVLLP